MRTWRLGSVGVALRVAPRLGAVLFVVALLHIGIISGYTFLSLRLVELGGSPSVVALSAGISAFAEVPSMLVAGWIAVRIGLRGLFAVGALLYGVAFLSWAVVGSVGLIIASRILIGFSFASVIIAVVLTIATLLPAELQATGQALFQTTAFGIAAIIANVVGGLLYSTAGHSAVFGLARGPGGRRRDRRLAGHAAPAGRPRGAVRATILSVGQPWIDPTVTGVGRVPMHSVPHTDRLDLDGTWRFQLLRRPDAATAADDWRDIEVPGCWTLQDTFDEPHYTNVQMPFPGQPPDEIPELNPTGVYERTVRAPRGLGRASGSCSTSAPPRACSSRPSTGSRSASARTPTSPRSSTSPTVSRPGTNTLTLRVVKWSDATFVEDQDQWWHGGITRSVFLYATGARPPRRHQGRSPAWPRT